MKYLEVFFLLVALISCGVFLSQMKLRVRPEDDGHTIDIEGRTNAWWIIIALVAFVAYTIAG